MKKFQQNRVKNQVCFGASFHNFSIKTFRIGHAKNETEMLYLGHHFVSNNFLCFNIFCFVNNPKGALPDKLDLLVSFHFALLKE